jgi:hypothetical protein
MSGQNCEPLIAELKKLVTVENDQAYKLLQELLSGVTTLERQLAGVRNLAERLKGEAQIHAQEARTANATVAEIYQVLTGATGEPGNWNGAEPARKLMAQLQQAREERDTALGLLSVAKCPNCDGSGATIGVAGHTIPRCCGRFLPSGECCGHAIPECVQEQYQEPCEWCFRRNEALPLPAAGEKEET